MKDIRETIARNICELRTENGLTQAKLAEALNYSDKAVSKWERAESVPDIVVLKMLADYFGVTVDYIVSDVHSAEQIRDKNKSVQRHRNRLMITLLAASLVWLIFTFVFAVLLMTDEQSLPAWLMFVYALPTSGIVFLVFNSIWGRRRLNYFIISFMIWTTLLSIYLTFLLTTVKLNIWPVFIIGIPAQLIVFLWAGLVIKRKITPVEKNDGTEE